MLIASLVFLQVLIFVGLIFMLRRIIDRNVTSATRHLEEMDSDFVKKEGELNKKLDDIRMKSQEILDKAHEEAEREKERIVKEGEAERDKVLNDSRLQSTEIINQADKSRQALLSEINERIQKEAVEKACELIQDTLPENFKKDVHGQWVEDLIETGFDRLKKLNLPEEIKEVKVTSALPLSDKQRKDISGKLESVLGNKVSIKEDINPKVVVGIIISIGNLVLDGSLRNKIKEKTKNA